VCLLTAPVSRGRQKQQNRINPQSSPLSKQPKPTSHSRKQKQIPSLLAKALSKHCSRSSSAEEGCNIPTVSEAESASVHLSPPGSEARHFPTTSHISYHEQGGTHDALTFRLGGQQEGYSFGI